MGTPLSAMAPYAPVTVAVRGKVKYSHIKNLVEGTELEKANQKRIAQGNIPYDRPYTAITIEDAYIVDNGTLNPAVKQFFENEKIKNVTKPDGTITKTFYGQSKSPNPPDVAYSVEAGNLAGQILAKNREGIQLQGELASGLDVTIGASIYKARMGVGLGIDYVLVNEPVRFYQNSALDAALAAQGVATHVAPGTQTVANTQSQTPVQTEVPTQTETTPVAVSPMASVVQPQAAPATEPQPQVQAQPQPQVQTQQAAPAEQIPAQAQAQAAQAAASPMVSGIAGAGPAYGTDTSGQPTLNYVPNN